LPLQYGFQKKVHHFFLMFILLLPFKDLLQYLCLKKLLKQFLKMKEIARKLWGDIILGSLEERQVLVSKSIRFPFLTLKKKSRMLMYNKTKKRHYIKRSLPRNRFQKKSTFRIRSAQKEQIDKQWLQISMGERCRLTRMMRLGTFLLL